MTASTSPPPFGLQLKRWRKQRRLSQLDLSAESGVTPRHLSFIETGRSRPGRDVILRICEALALPLRDRNTLLVTAGFTAAFPETRLSDEALAPFRRIVEQMLERHDPFPGFAIDRHWNVVDANESARALFLEGRSPRDAPVNAVDLVFGDPRLRETVENWPEIAWFAVARLRQELEVAGNEPTLEALLDMALSALRGVPPPPYDKVASPAVCTRMRVGDTVLSTASTVVRFGSPREVTLDELRIELVFPTDDATEAFFNARPWRTAS